MSNLFVFGVKFYQVTFGFFLGGNCRYYPSCSHYAVECFQNLPFFQALKFVTKRFLSCHPFGHKKLYDPPPKNI